MDKQKGLAPILIILLIALAVGGYFLYQKQVKPVSQPVIQSSPSPVTTQIASSSTDTANWKTYTSNKIGYSIQVPVNWIVTQNEDDSLLTHQDHVTNMTVLPDHNPGSNDTGSIEIEFPIAIQGPHYDVGETFEKGLKGLEVKPTKGGAMFARTDSSYLKINGKNTLMTVQVYNTTPPPDFRGSWCNCTHKHYYIDLGNGKILDIVGYWPNSNSRFEQDFDQILSTFKFTQ